MWVVGLIYEVLLWAGFENNSWWSWTAMLLVSLPLLGLAGFAAWEGRHDVALFCTAIGLGIVGAKIVLVRLQRRRGQE